MFHVTLLKSYAFITINKNSKNVKTSLNSGSKEDKEYYILKILYNSDRVFLSPLLYFEGLSKLIIENAQRVHRQPC